MPVRAHPLSSEMIFALAGICWDRGYLELCCLLPLAYTSLLRTAELFSLRRDHVSFAAGKASLSLAGKSCARTGQPEEAVCDDGVALKLLLLLCASKAGPELLLNMTEYRFRRLWKEIIEELELCAKAYQPYGLRRGGACEDFSRYGDGGRLMIRGRWSNMRTARIYAQEALRVRQLSEVSDASKAKIAYWGDRFKIRFTSL